MKPKTEMGRTLMIWVISPFAYALFAVWIAAQFLPNRRCR